MSGIVHILEYLQYFIERFVKACSNYFKPYYSFLSQFLFPRNTYTTLVAYFCIKVEIYNMPNIFLNFFDTISKTTVFKPDRNSVL